MNPKSVAVGMDLDHERLGRALVELGESIGGPDGTAGSTDARVTKDAPVDDIVTVSLTVDYNAPADNDLLMEPLQYETEAEPFPENSGG